MYSVLAGILATVAIQGQVGGYKSDRGSGKRYQSERRYTFLHTTPSPAVTEIRDRGGTVSVTEGSSVTLHCSVVNKGGTGIMTELSN